MLTRSPRVLARLPYGQKTIAVNTFAFEEPPPEGTGLPDPTISAG